MSSHPGLAQAKYSALRWNTPLSEDHAGLLIERLAVGAGASVLDLGCGWGELLARVVDAGPDCVGVGVDTDAEQLERGRRLVRERGLDERVTLVRSPAEDWAEPADRVICVGAAHAWGGTAKALAALGVLVAPGGRLLFGDGCWEAEPTPAAAAIFGEDILALPAIADCARNAGWRTLHLSTADQREWDDFESGWRRGREEWLLVNPDSEATGALRADLHDRLIEYVRDYRGVLGFCYLVLGR